MSASGSTGSALGVLLTRLGAAVIGKLALIGSVGLLMLRAFLLLPGQLCARRGRALAYRNLVFQMYRVGVRSAGVVGLVTFCIGAILALQIGPILREYGALDQLASLIGVAMFREMGPLIGAIVLTGFAGASIAAEIGTMAVGEELKALKAHAINPVAFLVVPRVLATTVMTVCLAVLSDWLGVVGGAFTGYLALDIPVPEYVRQTFSRVTIADVGTGLIKAAVFGVIIGTLACQQGMAVRGGAEGVGNATTRTVVLSIVALVVVDLWFTFVFYMVGI